MALLSEDDRKLIMGKDWKPLVATPDDTRKNTVLLVVVAILAVAVIGYFIFGTTGPTKVAANMAPASASVH